LQILFLIFNFLIINYLRLQTLSNLNPNEWFINQYLPMGMNLFP
jgi:hypothetical protein